MGLLGGAVNLTKTDKPLLLFECGLGASDYYGVMLGEIFQFFETELSYNIFTFVAYLKGIKPLISRGFVETYESKSGYYFVAVSKG